MLALFLLDCTSFLCSARRHILDVSLQDSKMLISSERSCKNPPKTLWLQVFSCGSVQQLKPTIPHRVFPSNSVLNHRQEGPHYIGIHNYKQVEKENVFPIKGEMTEPEQGLFFHVLLQLLGSSSLMSLMITYHSLAIDCDSPPNLQRSTGVMAGRKVCGVEGGGRGPLDTGLQVSLVGFSSVVHIRQFGPWSVSRGNLEVTETSPFGPLTFEPSDLPCASIKPQTVSFWECCFSLSSFGLHEWLCVSQWSGVYSAVTQCRVSVVMVGFNTVWLSL